MTAQSEPSRDPAIKAFAIAIAIAIAIALAAFRAKGGMSKRELAERLGYTPAYVSQIEASKNVPSLKFAEDLDTLFDTEAFTGLRKNITDARSGILLPARFIDYVEHEAHASLMYVFEFGVIPGIFQTYDYAYEVLRSGRTVEEIEQLVSKRIERQQILTKSNPPQVVAIFDESIIRRVVGSRKIMKGQVDRLIEIAKMPNVTMHVVSMDKGAYPGIMGAFIILRFDDGPDMVYTEGHVGGNLTDHAATVRGHTVRFDLIRGAAMAADESLALLRTVGEGL